MISTTTLMAATKDTQVSWMFSLREHYPEMAVFSLEIQVPLPESFRNFRGAVTGLLNIFTELRESDFATTTAKRWLWKDAGISPSFEAYRKARLAANIDSALFPRLPDQKCKDVAFILPLVSFGGVEKVAFALAREMARNGWRVNLLVVDGRRVSLPEDVLSFVSAITFVDDGSVSSWAGRPYLGTNDDKRNEDGDHTPFLGLLAGMDLVINAHSAYANGAMGALRRYGTKTAVHLHVNDQSAYGRMQGHPYLALAYEHAYDYVLTCSQKMADWLLGMGVPSAKLCAIPNAHGYVVSEQERDRIVAARHAFDGTRKLRVLFIGRFDRQKGLERAVKQAQLAATNGLAIEWRFVGSRVVGDDVDEATAKTLASLSVPAAYETRKLNEHFAWADILFVPSHWEGLPLTILEAMRLGCVPFATRVGAVEEAIADGINGLLIQDYNDQTVHDTFREILKGKLSLTSMISGGKNTSDSRTWATAAQAFPLVKQGYKLKT